LHEVLEIRLLAGFTDIEETFLAVVKLGEVIHAEVALSFA
jgi:hypothetical protein